MSGGLAYVWDKDHDLYLQVNHELINLEMVTSKTDKEELYALLQKHKTYTNSAIASEILADYENNLKHFKKIMPKDYAKIHALIKEYTDKGYNAQEAQMKAFEFLYS